VEELSKKCYSLLKDYYRHREYRISKPTDDFIYLYNAGYIETKSYDFSNPNQQIPQHRISNKGIIYVEKRKVENRRWWIPIIISILALGLSLFALLK